MKQKIYFYIVFVVLVTFKVPRGLDSHMTPLAATMDSSIPEKMPAGRLTKVDTTDRFSSSNLPIVVIDTDSQQIINNARIVVQMGIIHHPERKRNFITDSFNDFYGKIAIEIRGSSSTQFPKKQYAFETRDDNNNNFNVSLLGLPPENDWILYAPYSDKSLMRNVLAYKLSRDLGRYASRTRYCELVLNGKYWGIYVLMEKIKQDKNRVNIAKLEPHEICGDDRTGGYIIKLDKTTGDNNAGWHSSYPTYLIESQRLLYQYHDPKPSEIVIQQQVYIQNFIYGFETIMNDSGFADPDSGYPSCIDVGSFVDHFILNELAKNVDAYRLSAFMYKDKDSKGGKLTMGPIWDFNLSFGNAKYQSGQNTTGWMVFFPSNYGRNRTPFWWPKLATNDSFMYQVSKRWHYLRNDIFDMDVLMDFIDSVAVYLQEAQVRNFTRWPILGVKIWPNYFVGKTYQEEVNYLKQWLQNRIEWLDEILDNYYYRVIWSPVANVTLNGQVGIETPVSIAEFLQDTVNIDSIIFSSDNKNLLIKQEVDTLRLMAVTENIFNFYGCAYRKGLIVSISPIYHYTSLITASTNPSAKTVQQFQLWQNHPNPFNPVTTIAYYLPVSTTVILKIYNTCGQELQILIHEKQNPGFHSTTWDGKGDSGTVGSGVFFYQLTTGTGIVATKKMLRLR